MFAQNHRAIDSEFAKEVILELNLKSLLGSQKVKGIPGQGNTSSERKETIQDI